MEERKTRKNKRIMIVAAVLILPLAILCLGGVTFAKYVTKANVPTQQATVAKWGYVVTVNTNDMFAEAYKDDGTKTTAAAVTTDGKAGVTVLTYTTGTTKNRVAPGTKGSMIITLSGTAEVASVITFKETGTTKDVSLTRAADADNGVTAVDYKPVKWTLEKTGEANALVNKSTLADCITALKAQFTGAVQAPGTDISAEYTLSWEWEFRTGTSDDEKDENDVYDTILGYAAEGKDDSGEVKYLQGCTAETEIAFGFTIAIEQSQTGATA